MGEYVSGYVCEHLGLLRNLFSLVQAFALRRRRKKEEENKTLGSGGNMFGLGTEARLATGLGNGDH